MLNPRNSTLRAPWLALLFCAAMAVSGQAMAVTPKVTVKRAVDEIIKILKTEGLGTEDRWQRIGYVIDRNFDFRSMSQSVLATQWQKATPEEKRRFVEYFSQYLEDTYRTKIEAYTNQSVEYASEQIRGPRAVVDTFIVTDANRIPVSYKLKLNDDGWYCYDVVIEGISLVSNYRSTFAAIAKTEGINGLLLDLQGRIDAYKKEHGIQDDPAAAPGAGQGSVQGTTTGTGSGQYRGSGLDLTPRASGQAGQEF